MSGACFAEPYVTVISSGRPGNAAHMEHLLATYAPTWYVGWGEGRSYRERGAARVIESGPLIASRNLALDDAGDRACVQVSDDLRKLEITTSNQKEDVRPASFQQALAVICGDMEEVGARLGGVAPTANPYFFHGRLKTHGFIVGDFCVVAPTRLRFDPALRLKEDYDYTILHLEVYGCVARSDAVLATFAHRTNSGGAVGYRTAKAEQEAIAYLKAKWPAWVRDNPRRPNEILLRRGTKASKAANRR